MLTHELENGHEASRFMVDGNNIMYYTFYKDYINDWFFVVLMGLKIKIKVTNLIRSLIKKLNKMMYIKALEL